MHDHVITVGTAQGNTGIMPAAFILQNIGVDLGRSAVIGAVGAGIRQMVGNYIGDDLDAFFMRGIAQGLQLRLSAEPVVAVGDAKIDRLIKMPPNVSFG